VSGLKSEPARSAGIQDIQQGAQGPYDRQSLRGLPGEEVRLVFNAEEKAALYTRTNRELVRAVVAQCVMAALATGLAWVIAGTAAGLSALVGAGAYLVPNTLFALRLLLDAHRPGGAHPFTFFLGEAFKLGATVLLLWLAVHLGGGKIVWPAMLIGLVCTLKGYVLLLMFSKLS
jgi:ATP synthase protein I